MTGGLLGVGDVAVNKTDDILAPLEFTSWDHDGAETETNNGREQRLGKYQ